MERTFNNLEQWVSGQIVTDKSLLYFGDKGEAHFQKARRKKSARVTRGVLTAAASLTLLGGACAVSNNQDAGTVDPVPTRQEIRSWPINVPEKVPTRQEIRSWPIMVRDLDQSPAIAGVEPSSNGFQRAEVSLSSSSYINFQQGGPAGSIAEEILRFQALGTDQRKSLEMSGYDPGSLQSLVDHPVAFKDLPALARSLPERLRNFLQLCTSGQIVGVFRQGDQLRQFQGRYTSDQSKVNNMAGVFSDDEKFLVFKAAKKTLAFIGGASNFFFSSSRLVADTREDALIVRQACTNLTTCVGTAPTPTEVPPTEEVPTPTSTPTPEKLQEVCINGNFKLKSEAEIRSLARSINYPGADNADIESVKAAIARASCPTPTTAPTVTPLPTVTPQPVSTAVPQEQRQEQHQEQHQEITVNVTVSQAATNTSVPTNTAAATSTETPIVVVFPTPTPAPAQSTGTPTRVPTFTPSIVTATPAATEMPQPFPTPTAVLAQAANTPTRVPTFTPVAATATERPTSTVVVFPTPTLAPAAFPTPTAVGTPRIFSTPTPVRA